MGRRFTVPVVLLISVFFASCGFAALRDLPPEPARDIFIEILDQSAVTANPSEYALVYTGFTTTSPSWLEFLSIQADVYDPGQLQYISADLTGSILADGNAQVYHLMNRNRVAQGKYELRLYAVKENNEIVDRYEYSLNVDVGGGGNDIYTRAEGGGSVYVMPQESSYSVAISDDGASVFFRPENSFSAGLDVSFFFRFEDGYVHYVTALPASLLSNGVWTEIAVADLQVQRSPEEAITVVDFRPGAGNKWTVESYASLATLQSWGNLVRSELRGADIQASAP